MIRVVTTSEHVHEVEIHLWKVTLLLAAWSMLYVHALISGVSEPSRTRHPIRGPLAGIVLTDFCAVLFYEKARFVFNTQRKTVTWYRRSLYSRSSGEIPFGEIRAIVLESGGSACRSSSGGWRIRDGVHSLQNGL